MKNTILSVSRQDTIGPLTGWMENQLEKLIQNNSFKTEEQIDEMRKGIIQDLSLYREQSGINTVVVGMSGGVDSSLAAALFKEAGWRVIGLALPIHQNPEETDRGLEAIRFLKLDENSDSIDLTEQYESLQWVLNDGRMESVEEKIRQGNIRARIRMITLYNEASKFGGLVASTDNFSELTAGFWTLHGDVGDLSPIQSLWKSWEVPIMARLSGVPESIIQAHPTDGLGVDTGDEAQFGCSYLEWDIMVMSFMQKDTTIRDTRSGEVYNIVEKRMKRTAYKRYNPAFINNPLDSDRFSRLAELDLIWTPKVLT